MAAKKKPTEEKKEKKTTAKIKDFLDGVTDSKSFKMLKNVAFLEFKNQIHEKIDNFKQKIISRIEFLILITLGTIYLLNGLLKLLSTVTNTPVYAFEIIIGAFVFLIAFIVRKK